MEDLYKKWERLREDPNTEFLVSVYYEPERYYPGLPEEEYKVIKDIILDELKKRKWFFCPIHNVPLRPKYVRFILYLHCPVGKEIYMPRDSRVEPVARALLEMIEPAWIHIPIPKWEPSEYMRKEKIKEEYKEAKITPGPEIIERIIDTIKELRIRYPTIPEPPPAVDVNTLKRILHRLAYDERLPQTVRRLFLDYYWML
jgi:hypothetical protein